MQTTLGNYSFMSPDRPQRWLLPALAVSFLLHVLVLVMDTRENPVQGESRLNIRLRDTAVITDDLMETPRQATDRTGDAPPQEIETSTPLPATVPAETMAPGRTPGAGMPLDWKAEIRSAIRSQAPRPAIYEKPPLEHFRIDKDVEGPRIPGLAEAFRPLERPIELCPTEVVFDLGNRQIVLPATRACTQDDENAKENEIIRRRLEKLGVRQ